MNKKAYFVLIALLFGLVLSPIAASAACSIVINSPDGGEILAGTSQISWNEEGNCPQDKYNLSYSPDGGSNYVSIEDDYINENSNPKTYDWDTMLFSDSNSAMIRVCDKNGANCDISNAVFTADNSNPTTSDDSDGSWHNTDQTITLACSDSISGCAATYYTLDGSDPTEDSDSGTSVFVSEEGIITIKYLSKDAAGNLENVKTATVNIDKTNPTINAEPSGTLGFNGWYLSSVSISFACEDQSLLSGVAECPLDYIIDSEGSSIVEGTAFDNAGNSQAMEPFEIDIDKSAPSASLQVYSGSSYFDEDNEETFVASSTLLELAAEDSISGVETLTYDIDEEETFDYEEPFNLAGGDGDYTINFESSDSAGNTFEDSAYFVLDNSYPSTVATLDEANGANGWHVDSEIGQKISLQCSDSGSGAFSITYWWDDEEQIEQESNSVDVPIDNPGTHTISFYCTDNVGNQEEEQAIEGIKYDDDSPETAIEVSGEKALANVYRSDITVALTCIDSTSGCELGGEQETVFYSLDGLEFAEATGEITITGEGEHTIAYYSEDVAGNANEEQTSTYFIDPTSPILIVSPLTILSSIAGEFAFTGTLMEQLQDLPISWDFGDGSEPATSESGQEISHLFESEGIYTVTATVSDEESSVSEEAILIVGSAEYGPEDAPNISMSFTELPEGAYSLAANESSNTSRDTSGFLAGNNFFEITSDLANGNFSVALTFSYADADQDGVVDGTGINENNLNVYYFDEDAGSWVIADANPLRDADANTITITVDHFTSFALLAAISTQSTSSGGSDNGGSSSGGFISSVPAQLTQPANSPQEELPRNVPSLQPEEPEAIELPGPEPAAEESGTPELPITGFIALAQTTAGKSTIAIVLIALAFGSYIIYKKRKSGSNL